MMEAVWTAQLWWWVLLPTFLAGLAVGALVVYLAVRTDHVERLRLQAEVTRLEGEIQEYRQHVYRHFRRTSDLFQSLTDSYRAFYEHLADGARSLCSEERLTPALDIPRSRLLGAAEGQEGQPEVEAAAGGAPPPGGDVAGGQGGGGRTA
jgi:uncharacterized membrane-anchored protein YhcB (DUF1043 family)